MLPVQGWLAEQNNTNIDPVEGPLPVEYSGRYYEGGDGVIVGSTELDFRQVSAIFVLSFIRERFGYGRSQASSHWVRILNIDLVQQNAFGVILLDSFTPPAVANEFFEFLAYTQDACCDDCPVELVSVYSGCTASELDPTFMEDVVPTPVFTET